MAVSGEFYGRVWGVLLAVYGEILMAIDSWANALRALRTQPALKNGWYVEGWAVLDYLFPIEHGWVELPDSRIVDPTYALILNRGSAREPTSPAYFAGVRYTRGELKGVRVSTLPRVYTFGWGGWKHEPYKKAYFDAWTYCGKLELGQQFL